MACELHRSLPMSEPKTDATSDAKTDGGPGDSSLGQATHLFRGRQRNGGIRELFHQFSHRVSLAVGSPYAFIIAVLVVVAWAASGSMFGYSDTWQLVINTGTTIVTFLM